MFMRVLHTNRHLVLNVNTEFQAGSSFVFVQGEYLFFHIVFTITLFQTNSSTTMNLFVSDGFPAVAAYLFILYFNLH